MCFISSALPSPFISKSCGKSASCKNNCVCLRITVTAKQYAHKYVISGGGKDTNRGKSPAPSQLWGRQDFWLFLLLKTVQGTTRIQDAFGTRSEGQKTCLNQSSCISSDLSQAEKFSVLSCPKDNLIHHFFLCSYKLSSRQTNQRSNCQHLLDPRKSKRGPEKHLFLLCWLCQSLWLCGSQ